MQHVVCSLVISFFHVRTVVIKFDKEINKKNSGYLSSA